MMVAVGLARVGVGVKIRTPAYTLIYPHLDQQMIIMTLIMGMLVMVVKYHQMLSTTVHKHIRIHPEASQTSWLMYFVRRKVRLFQKCPFYKSAPFPKVPPIKTQILLLCLNFPSFRRTALDNGLSFYSPCNSLQTPTFCLPGNPPS